MKTEFAVDPFCVHPGKMNSSLSRSVSNSTLHAPSGPAPSSVRREPGLSRPRRSTLSASAEPLSSRTGFRSQPTQAKKPPDAEQAKAARSTPLKRAESTPVQPTPPKRTGSVGATCSVRLQSGVKTRSKPRGLVHPTSNMADNAEGENIRWAFRLMFYQLWNLILHLLLKYSIHIQMWQIMEIVR